MAYLTGGATFGPYLSAATARHHFRMFQHRAFPRQRTQGWGIVWSENGRACVLQPPALDGDGDGLALVYQWSGPVPASPPPAGARKPGAKSLTAILEEHFATAVDAFADSNTVTTLHNAIVDHPKTFDSVNVALDIWGIVSGVVGAVYLTTRGLVTKAALGEARAAGAADAAGAFACAALLSNDLAHLAIEGLYGDAAAKILEGTADFQAKEQYATLVAMVAPLREAARALGPRGYLGALKAEKQLAEAKLALPKRPPKSAKAQARAKRARANLVRLQTKAAKLRAEVQKYFTLKVYRNPLKATATRDLPMAALSIGNLTLNFPGSEHFGEPVNPSPEDWVLQALVPASLSSAAAADFMQHLTVAVAAVSSGQGDNG